MERENLNGHDETEQLRLPIDSARGHELALLEVNKKLEQLREKAGDSARLELNLHRVVRNHVHGVRLTPNDINILVACCSVAPLVMAIAEWEARGSDCDVCHKHDEPRGSCTACPQCPACREEESGASEDPRAARKSKDAEPRGGPSKEK